ncbi:MAG: hypothetical protein CMF71_09310 [Magnetovibrio sp.]|nr:hypothetical protein [Magnetovibrio sp.]|tara:strand:+ start:592 stop:2313 length:1722 start_codon:yes stop_codon:yes gene_type:complete
MWKSQTSVASLLSKIRVNADNYALLWTGLWIVMVATAIGFRPLLPVDETRYLAVAWEMWRDGNFLVPHLNGETYSHKPPLLFWLMHLGWFIFGVNDWWPRIIAPLFGLINLFLTRSVAKHLWPSKSKVATVAPLILMACLFWTLFTTLTMFDMLLAFCTLLAMLGVIRAWQKNQPCSFVFLTLAIGIGLLTKGPAILLTALPVALLVPFWGSKQTVSYTEFNSEGNTWNKGLKQWYFNIGLATLGGVIIALLWAIPAAIIGGDEYSDAIFWGQSAGRMVNSFAHARPWWWFLAVLPALLLPWTIWPATWRAMRGLRYKYKDNGIQFCLAWFLPALVTFSCISGKQLHYLLPVFPALALIGGRLLVDHHQERGGQGLWKHYGLHIPASLFITLGLFLILAPTFIKKIGLLPMVVEVDFMWGVLLALLAVALIYFGQKTNSLKHRAASIATMSVALVVFLHLSLKPVLNERYNLKTFSEQLRKWQESGISIAYLGKYHGMFNFLGRLEAQVRPVGLQYPDLENWQKANPNGYLIVPVGKKHEEVTPIYTQPYRGRRLIVISARQSITHTNVIGNP